MTRRLVLSVLAVVTGGCSWLFDVSDDAASHPSDDAAPPDGGVAASDALPIDASVDVADRDAVDAGAPNLVENGDFEQGCAFWQADQNTNATAASVARSGAQSCRICAIKETVFDFVQQNPVVADATQYRAEAWVHGDFDAATVAGPETLSIDVEDDAGWDAGGFGKQASPNDEWLRLTASVVVAPGQRIRVRFSANTGIGQCVLVDDVELRAQP